MHVCAHLSFLSHGRELDDNICEATIFLQFFQILIYQLWKIQEKNSKGRDRSTTQGSITDYINNLDFSVPFDFCKLIFTCVLLQKPFPLLDYL